MAYEQKARKFGRSSWYLQFAKQEQEKQFTKASQAHLNRLQEENN